MKLSHFTIASLTGLALTVGAPIATYADDAGTVSGQVTSSHSRFLPETVVYLKTVSGSFSLSNHKMGQVKMTFVPHVLAITQGDTVTFSNSDGMDHNVYSPGNGASASDGYNLGMISKGESKEYTFKNDGAYAQLCSLHPEMLAYVFVGQNPFMAVVDQNGKYQIPNVPVGTYEIAVWNSRLKDAGQNVAVATGQTATVNFAIHR